VTDSRKILSENQVPRIVENGTESGIVFALRHCEEAEGRRGNPELDCFALPSEGRLFKLKEPGVRPVGARNDKTKTRGCSAFAEHDAVFKCEARNAPRSLPTSPNLSAPGRRE
jgi:hypothetical protein